MKLLNILLINLLSFSALAEVREFAASYGDSAWNYSGNSLVCKLSHSIPNYGTITFTHKAGEIETGQLVLTYERGIKATLAELFFTKPQTKNRDGWQFQFSEHKSPIILAPRQVRQIFDGLNEGFTPTISHVDNTDRRVHVYAMLSPITFQIAYNSYSNCVEKMIPVSWKTIKNSNIYFEDDSVRLSEEARIWLDYIIEYAYDPAIRRVELNAYSDSKDDFRESHELATHRVEIIRNYLVNAGFNERKLRLRVYSERQNSKAGRQHPANSNNNQRVEIKMFR